MSDEGSPSDLLAAYDAQLRCEAEMTGATSVDRQGPLWRAVTPRGGFVSYRDLDGLEGDALDDLIAGTVAYYRDRTEVAEFEWKSRGHDRPDDLGERLETHGLVPEEVETVMVGPAAGLTDGQTPDGVTIRAAGQDGDLTGDVRRAMALQASVFGRGDLDVEGAIARLGTDQQLWLAVSGGEVISAGRLQRVSGTHFAGLWGGCTAPAWRGRGAYRALTAARARSVLAMGVRFLHSDCTAMSRPILERRGLVAVTTTTPYIWRRQG